MIEHAIAEEPPIAMRDGGYHPGWLQCGSGYAPTMPRTEGKTWLAKLEAEEREKTGIKNLKIKYNKVFGYYLEVTNSFKDLVPDYYTRKQTLANAERYITPELKELEDTILGAEDKLYALEYESVSVRSGIQIACRSSADPEDSQSSGTSGCVCFPCTCCGTQ